MTGRGGTTNCHFLAVKRIVQPKFRVTMNNTHPTYYGWVDIPGLAHPLQSDPVSAPIVSGEILAGTRVIFRRGTDPAGPGTEAYRININENTTFTVQP